MLALVRAGMPRRARPPPIPSVGHDGEGSCILQVSCTKVGGKRSGMTPALAADLLRSAFAGPQSFGPLLAIVL